MPGSSRISSAQSLSQSQLSVHPRSGSISNGSNSNMHHPHHPSGQSQHQHQQHHTFTFLKTRGKEDRRTRERSETEGSHSLFKDLRTSMSGHRRGTASSVTSRASDDHTDAAGSSSSRGIDRTGSEVSLGSKYGRPDEVLGKGANATVKLLTHRIRGAADRLYAIKEFRKKRKDETEKEYVKKVISEFCISSSIHHENIVETVDLIRDEHGRWCVVMEYCAGGDLFHKTMSVGFSCDEEIHCLFRQLLNGVGFIHSIGVAHRDLKPENIILDGTGRILKITDFGTSAVFRTQWEKEAHKLHGVYGSAPYIAPEEWDEQHEYIPTKVDVWACGVIFFAMLSKSLLWTVAKPSDEHYAAYLKKRETGFTQFLRYPPGPCKVLHSCLDPDPVRRPEIAQLIEGDWVSRIEFCIGAASTGKPTRPVQHTHLMQSSKH